MNDDFYEKLRQRGMVESVNPGTHVIGRLDQEHYTWLGREVTEQSLLWVDIHGNVILIQSMSKDYCLNVLCFLYERHYGDIVPPRRNPLVQALRERVLA